MINVYDQVPSVYTSASRDFQYLSWLINIVFNSVKHNVDDLYNLPNSKVAPEIAQLLATTLGFKIRRQYEQKQLEALVSVLPSVIRLKGTTEAIQLVGQALLRAAGSEHLFSCETINNCVVITIPKSLVDTNLFIDVLPYILPAGITCKIIRQNQIKLGEGFTTKLSQSNKVLRATWTDATIGSGVTMNAAEDTLATLYVPKSQDKPSFAYHDSDVKFNAGLLDNSIIPATRLSTVENEEN